MQITTWASSKSRRSPTTDLYIYSTGENKLNTYQNEMTENIGGENIWNPELIQFIVDYQEILPRSELIQKIPFMKKTG